MKTLFSFVLVFSAVICISAQEKSQVQKTNADTGYFRADLHVHLGSGSGKTVAERYKNAADVSASMGVVFGIAEEIEGFDIASNNKRLSECLNTARKYPVYLGLQVLMPSWSRKYSKELIDKLDFIACDALTFPDNGKIRQLWLPGIVYSDPQDFMERYVEYTQLVIADNIDIWINATYLPLSLQDQYNKLWTEARMKKVIDAAVKHNVAIEINSRYRIPSKEFILMAKAAGAKFTFGSNQHDIGIGEIAWSVRMARECGLTRQDFFLPERKLSGM